MGALAKTVILTAGLTVLVLGCAAPAAPNSVAPTPYAGYYRQGFEQSAFYPTNGNGPYWLSVEDEAVWSRIHEYYVPGPGRGGGITVRLVIEGRLETGGEFGHLGAYTTQLIAERILQIEAVDPEVFDARIAEMRAQAHD